MNKVIDSPRAVLGSIGAELGHTDWRAIDQLRIDRFAEVTGNRQWGLVGPELASAAPASTEVAHGYFVLALCPYFLSRLIPFQRLLASINLGCERARFPAPVLAGSRLRGRARITNAETQGASIQVIYRVTLDIEHITQPACVADIVMRHYFDV